ncbi:hypothetical protein [Streptomyces sp. NPDC049040]|uniref:hypothetical protein n=1 Tax=Streptomyces sp. NPDC049040 TaxID=3365593 RepID=UPI0037241327
MRFPLPAAAVLSGVLLGLAGCSSGGGDGKSAETPATGTPAASASAPGVSPSSATPPTAEAPPYRVYRDSPGGGTDIGLADLLLTGTDARNPADARAAIQDFVRLQDAKGTEVAYLVHVVVSKAADGRFICQGDWRKDAAAVTAFGGKQGLTINCPAPAASS